MILYDCDATVPEQVERLFLKIQSDYGPLCITVFNAGAFERREVVETDRGFRTLLADRLLCWVPGRESRRAGDAKARAGHDPFYRCNRVPAGQCRFREPGFPKFALRALAQSMARELSPHGIHVAHVIIDGQIRSERYQHVLGERGADSLLEPDAIADAYLAIHRQQRSAWTLELDLRPWVEKF